jgi:hypothetical protein
LSILFGIIYRSVLTWRKELSKSSHSRIHFAIIERSGRISTEELQVPEYADVKWILNTWRAVSKDL